MAGELHAAFAWTYRRLADDAELTALIGRYRDAGNIHRNLAPGDATFPLIVMQWQGGGDVGGVAAARVLTGLLLLVKAICRGDSDAPVVPVERRLDALLHGARGPAPDGTAYVEAWRREPFALPVPDIEGGVAHQHLGGIYAYNVHRL